MAPGRFSRNIGCIGIALCLLTALTAIPSAQAELVPGKKYDQTNYQEIQELLFPALLNWIKKGEVELQTANLEFEWKKNEDFLAASLQNEGKYGISKQGVLIEKSTGKPPVFVYGFPFPTIDPKDPDAGARIMENQAAQIFSMGTHNAPACSQWLSSDGRIERKLTSNINFLFYHQRREGMIANRNNYLFQELIAVVEPFNLRGSNTMIWAYNDLRENAGLVYVPTMRRVRRISVSDSSNPHLGSDFSTDDSYGWSGRNSIMKWRLVGEKNLLMPFSSAKRMIVKEFPDGAIDRMFTDLALGYEVPGWKGAPWYPVHVVWSPRSFWIVEARPKNSSYFYGKQIFYVDKDAYTSFIKEIFDQKEKYWKTTISVGGYQATAAGRNLVGILDLGLMIDDRTGHSCFFKTISLPGVDHRMNLPLSVLGPQCFTEDAFIQTTK